MNKISWLVLVLLGSAALLLPLPAAPAVEKKGAPLDPALPYQAKKSNPVTYDVVAPAPIRLMPSPTCGSQPTRRQRNNGRTA